MAHECPVCDTICYCGGDFNYFPFNDEDYIDQCSCCDEPDDKEES